MGSTEPNSSRATAGGRPIKRAMLGNVPLDRVGMDDAVGIIGAWRGRTPFRFVVTPNVDHVMFLQRDAQFRAAYDKAALSLLDGKPLQWAARWLGLGSIEKVSGSDLAAALCRLGAAEGWRIFIAGGRDENELRELVGGIGARYAGLTIEGASPPFGFERDAAATEMLLEKIMQFWPDILFMGCGSPKSEIWMARHAGRIGRGVGVSVGAGLRILAGRERRAPLVFQRLGLEWFWRLARDPRRLWRRYLVDDIRFFPLVWRWRREQRRMSNKQ